MRRAKGEGTLWRDDRGRWVGQASVGVNPATGKRKKVKVVGAEGESKASVAGRLAERIAAGERCRARVRVPLLPSHRQRIVLTVGI